MALAFPGQTGPLWEIIARDAFVESLGDPTLRLRVLERDPETLEQALKLASRLEALGYGEQDDNWDDVGRRKDRYAKASTAEAQEVSTLMQELRSELKQCQRERERRRKAVDGHRGGSEFVVGTADESVRPTRHFDQPAGGFSAGEWRASPMTQPAPSQAPPHWQAPIASPPAPPSTQYAGAAMWPPPPVSSPMVRSTGCRHFCNISTSGLVYQCGTTAHTAEKPEQRPMSLLSSEGSLEG